MTYPITIKPTTDGQTPKYTSVHPDGHRAVIDSVTGTVANGETLTINGHFSAKRNGDLFSLISTTADSGESVFATYHHTTAESFLGSGSCIMRSMHNPTGSPGDPEIDLGQHDELFLNYLYKLDVTGYGVGAEGPQIKTPRMMTKVGKDGSSIECGTNYIYGEGGTYAQNSKFEALVVGQGVIYPDPSEFDRYAATNKLLNGWVRQCSYFKANEAGKRNGAAFYYHKVEATKDCLFNWDGASGHVNDPRLASGTILTPFFTPKYFHEVADPVAATSGTGFRLHFYIKGGLIIDCYIDGLIINDSPESVWLVNSTDVDAAMGAGKAVQLPQLSRNAGTIEAECWLGDLTTSDNIYVTTFNQDGKYATPHLVRSAV